MKPVALRRPSYCLPPRPAREMSARGIAIVVSIYALLFGAAAARLWLFGG